MFPPKSGCKDGEEMQTGQREPPEIQPLCLQQGILGWPRILKSRAITELAGRDRPWGTKSKFKSQSCYCVSLGMLSCLL